MTVNLAKSGGPIKILLLEDDSKIASFIVKGLREEGHFVEHTDDGLIAYQRALSGAFDVVVVDLLVPGDVDGLTLIKMLRSKNSTIPVLILSAKRHVDDRVEGIDSGADDFLTKPFSFSELLARLHALVRRAKGFSAPSELVAQNLRLNVRTRKVWISDVLIELQPKEFDLLKYLLENANTIVTKTALIEHVWNFNFDPRTNIVEARICHLREKIERDGNTLIQTVRGVGYVINTDSQV